jgi:hypothetical protein
MRRPDVEDIGAAVSRHQGMPRLWQRWGELDANLDGYAALRSSPTAVVILEPQPADATGAAG